MMEEAKKSDLAIDVYGGFMCEYPFFRPDMTVEEYDNEKKYYGEHFSEVKNGTYIPLWKQNVDRKELER